MPRRCQQPCKTAGCSSLIDTGTGYCKRHQDQKPSENRPNANQRGYDYQWLKFREAYVFKHPLCVDCLAAGTVTATEEVHHIAKVAQHPELKLVDGNLMALCKSCHSVRTNRGQ
jgi:5-methylcytosine-specific restriction protein A